MRLITAPTENKKSKSVPLLHTHTHREKQRERELLAELFPDTHTNPVTCLF